MGLLLVYCVSALRPRFLEVRVEALPDLQPCPTRSFAT